MPIRPENRDRYPDNWAAISRHIRFARALGRCECEGECGTRHRGRCTARHNGKHPATGSKVVLTVAHLDHTPENCDPANLRAMCQHCDVSYDADEHTATRARTKAAETATWNTPLPRLDTVPPAPVAPPPRPAPVEIAPTPAAPPNRPRTGIHVGTALPDRPRTGTPAADWPNQAACQGEDIATFFPDKGGSAAAAKAICARCPVADMCLADALATPWLVGIWGGTNYNTRRDIREGRKPSPLTKDTHDADR